MTGSAFDRLVEEGRAAVEGARAKLADLEGPALAWQGPLLALLTMADRAVAGAGALGGHDEAGDGVSPEMAEALDELRRAVIGLVERVADLLDPDTGRAPFG